MISYREALSHIGEPGPDGVIPAFRDGYATAPASLSEAIVAMADPRPAEWSLPVEEHIDAFWTENCQGVAVGGGHWFFPSNGSWFGVGDVTPRAIFKFSGSQQVGQFVVHDDDADHLGDVDYSGGQVFAALEGSPKSQYGSAVLSVDETFTFSQVLPLLGENGGAPPQGGEMPWCAINPWNGLLYSSPFGDTHAVKTVFAYRPADDGWRNAPAENIHLRGHHPTRVQGGAFSPRGHLYLTSDAYVDDVNKGVHVFSGLNGAYRGVIKVLALDDNQELEGLCFAALNMNGSSVQLHVVLLEQLKLEKDDIFLKHYAAPNPMHV